MSEAKQGDGGATSDKPGKSSRNPIERVIVWGVILALLVVVGIEFWAKSKYQSALDELQSRLEASENDGSVLYRSEVEDIVKKHGVSTPAEPVEKTSATHGKHQEAVYTWNSLLREQKIYVIYTIEDERLRDEEANVIAIETDADRQTQQKAEEDAAALNAEPAKTEEAPAEQTDSQ